MEKKGWKITAITFMILFSSLSLLMCWGISLGLEELDNEEKCIVNVCGYSYSSGGWMSENDGYTYDSYDGLCSCWDGKYISHEEYIR